MRKMSNLIVAKIEYDGDPMADVVTTEYTSLAKAVADFNRLDAESATGIYDLLVLDANTGQFIIVNSKGD